MVKSLYIYGAGTRGKKFLDMLNKASDYAVEGFIDINAADKNVGGTQYILLKSL